MSRSGFTLEWLAARNARLAAAYTPTARSVPEPSRALRARASGAPTERASRMNGLERDYATVLELQRRAGDVVAWHFGALRLELGDGVWFRVDFVVVPTVIPAGFVLEAHETKGYMREAARVRLHVAARLYPWIRFRLVRRADGARPGLGAFTFADVPA
jgi:hypothetical protein